MGRRGRKRSARRGLRNAAFGLVTVVLVLLLFNTGVEFLEARGCIDTYRGRDDFVHHVDEALFTADGDDYATTLYARRTMVPSRFRGEKGPAWRMFVLGGSFAMGSPFVHQGHLFERSGGMSTRIRETLVAQVPGRPVEVINVAAGGHSSHRVRRIAERVVTFSPDVILVATCNNEGTLRPSVVNEHLRKFGGFRLLARVFSGSTPAEERSMYTPQDADTERIRAEFRENLEAIVQAAAAHDVSVLLATLPVNLRFDRGTEGHTIPSPTPTDGGSGPAPCVEEGMERFHANHPGEAITILERCEDVEAVRGRGLVELQRGNLDEARFLLEQYLELMPQNRCRPSFNAIIREIAAAAPHVTLVDLQARARALAPQGIPGEELFLDFCHMNRAGYAAMADEVLRVLRASGLGPAGAAPGAD